MNEQSTFCSLDSAQAHNCFINSTSSNHMLLGQSKSQNHRRRRGSRPGTMLPVYRHPALGAFIHFPAGPCGRPAAAACSRQFGCRQNAKSMSKHAQIVIGPAGSGKVLHGVVALCGQSSCFHLSQSTTRSASVIACQSYAVRNVPTRCRCAEHLLLDHIQALPNRGSHRAHCESRPSGRTF